MVLICVASSPIPCRVSVNCVESALEEAVLGRAETLLSVREIEDLRRSTGPSTPEEASTYFNRIVQNCWSLASWSAERFPRKPEGMELDAMLPRVEDNKNAVVSASRDSTAASI